MSEETPALPFTGERFTPECEREIRYEHWHRYAFARTLAAGRRVLDAACGEGYGSNLLAETGAEVVGVDISAEAIAHARSRYGERRNLHFEQGDATALALPPASFDLVVSFETLEHVAAQAELVAGFARVLRDDGILVVSSPDKHTYSEVAGFRNEFHVRELYRDELLALLRPHFPAIRLYGQKLLFQSALWTLDADLQGAAETWTATGSGAGLTAGLAYAPLYFVAVCARRALSPLPTLSLFGDREESVYAHYNREVRKNMAAGARIAGLEAELERLRATKAVGGEGATRPRRRWWPW